MGHDESTDPRPAESVVDGTLNAVVGGDFESRSSDRLQRILFGRVLGAHASFRAMVLNISRGGALLTILDQSWTETSEENSHLVGMKVGSHFGEGMSIELADLDEPLAAEVVRVALGNIGRRPVWLLGCRFEEALTDEMAAQVGLVSLEPAAAANDESGGGSSSVSVAVPEGMETLDQPVVLAAGGVLPLMSRRGDLRPKNSGRKARVRLVDGEPPVSMNDLLEVVVQKMASDLHLKAGSPVRLRVDSKLIELGDRPLTTENAIALASEILAPDQMQRFQEENDLDLAYSLESARFRINVLRSRGEIGLAIRRIPADVPTVEELGLAPVCVTIAERPRGLVLVTGPTGSGKSTTLAAMLRHINTTRPCHIVTMEDPIEYIHTEELAHITQREVGRDTKDFAAALKRSLRQDPDVILVGEMRDLETMSLAVTAAETGHLVFATLHTTSAPGSVDRIVDVFPPAQQRQVRMQLADALQAIFSQVLVPRIGGGVIVAQEILVASGGVRALIREGKTPQIGNMMQTGGKMGMQTLEDALNDLLARNQITLDTALAKANFPEFIMTPEQRAAKQQQRPRPRNR